MWAKSSAAALAALALIGPPAPPGRGPIALYEAGCVRCHGPNGSFYGPEFGKGKSDAQLKKAVEEMCDNQGQLENVTPVELEALTAYHRAILRKEPFVAVTEKGVTRLRGEASVGAAVTVRVGEKLFPTVRKGFVWSVTGLPIDAPVTVVATLARATVTLDPAKARHSHPAPPAGTTKP